MGLLDRFKKSRATNTADPCVANYQALLSDALGTAYLRQNIFNEQLTNDRPWTADLDAATITFDGTTYPIALLGTESLPEQSWLWSFANPGNFAPALTQSARTFRDYCVAQGCTQLQGDEVPLSDNINGHMLSCIASVWSENRACYYCCRYNDDVAAFVLVYNLPATIFEPVKVQAIASAINQLIMRYELDHEKLVQGLLTRNGAQIMRQANHVTGTLADGGQIDIAFDTQGRITGIKGSITNA